FVAIAITGTLWVMFHMNANMMPTHTDMPAAMEHSAQPEAATKAAP
ncbi:MAG: cytochrome o ubiquinol oxidase subunit IV, partial [Betaproteobacteria bacterium]|nr:cytochrome o ubiquinol oxidase subunit IV [Betaproteobacteria bacterium]